MRQRRALVGVAGGLVLVAAGAWVARVRLNLSASLAPGFYIVSPGDVARGSIVLACLPANVADFARARGYVPRGVCPGGTAPLGKLVLALSGDTVTVSAEGLSVNGALVPDSRAHARDGRGRPLWMTPVGRHLVGPSELWLISDHPLGYDSRYFGALRVSSVRAVVRPLWTWRQNQKRNSRLRRRVVPHVGKLSSHKGLSL